MKPIAFWTATMSALAALLTLVTALLALPQKSPVADAPPAPAPAANSTTQVTSSVVQGSVRQTIEAGRHGAAAVVHGSKIGGDVNQIVGLPK